MKRTRRVEIRLNFTMFFILFKNCSTDKKELTKSEVN